VQQSDDSAQRVRFVEAVDAAEQAADRITAEVQRSLHRTLITHRRGPAPAWVILPCCIAVGTLLGGWRIVETTGQRITTPTPVRGFCAKTGGAITLITTTALISALFYGLSWLLL
jgi:phosphate/sulfate permease